MRTVPSRGATSGSSQRPMRTGEEPSLLVICLTSQRSRPLGSWRGASASLNHSRTGNAQRLQTTSVHD